MSNKKKNGNATPAQTFSVEDCADVVSAFLAEHKFDKSVSTGTIAEDESLILWTVPCDPVVIAIGILEPRKEYPTFVVRSTLASLPESPLLPFYRRCLEINAGLGEGTLGVEGKDVSLSMQRFLVNLDPDEVYYKLTLMFNQAPAIATQIHDEFGPTSQPVAAE